MDYTMSNPMPTTGAQDQFWDRYQNEWVESFAGSRSRLRHLVHLARADGPVLNVGVGGGIFEDEAIAAGLDVYSLDPSERAIQALRSRLGLGDKAQIGYGQRMPFADHSFAAVVVSEVLEHLSDDELFAVLQEIHRVLRPGGRIVGTVPARERLADNQVVCLHCNQSFHRWGHHQSFDRQRIADLLARWFQVELAIERPFVNWPTLNWKGRIAGAIKLCLLRLGVHGSQENVVFCATKGARASARSGEVPATATRDDALGHSSSPQRARRVA